MTDSIVKRYPLPEIDEKFNSLDQGKRSIFALKTLNGFDFPEASSALQKAIRRGHWKDAMQWANEMSKVPIQGRSNLFNRLFVISVEDVGPADPKQFMIVNSLYNQYMKDKDNEMYAITAAVSLSKAEKTRVSDWAIHTHHFSQASVKGENVLLLINNLVDSFFKKDLKNILLYSAKLMATSEKVKVAGIRATIPIKVGIIKIQKRVCEDLHMNTMLIKALDKITGPSKDMNKPCRGGEGILFFINLAILWVNDVKCDSNISPNSSSKS